MRYEIGLFFLLFRYLISKGKGVEARSALQWLRGPGIDISYELADMGAKYLVFFSFCSLRRREKCISFAHLILYIF